MTTEFHYERGIAPMRIVQDFIREIVFNELVVHSI